MNAVKRIPWNFYGTWLIVISGIMAFTSAGTLYYGYPVFFPVIVKEFAWPAAIAATAASLGRVEGAFEGPLVGWVLDKYGPRIVTIFGGVTAGVGLIAMAWMNDILWYYILYGVVVIIGQNACLYVPSYKAIATWWVKWRARGMALFVLPTGIGGTFSPMIAAWGISNFGWRTSIIAMGVLLIVVFVPCGILTRPKRPEAYGLLPDGDDPKKVSEVAVTKSSEQALARETMKKEIDFTLREAMKTRPFWMYAFGNTFISFGTGGVIPFLPALLISRGFDIPTAAFYAGIMVTISYTGRFAVMFFADALTPKWMWVGQCFLLGVGSISAALATPDASYFAWGYSVFYGVGFGMMVPLQPAFRGWLFGRTAFGVIGGVLGSLAIIGSVAAPAGAGYAFDATGTYFPAYVAFGAALLFAGIVFVFVNRPKPKEIPQSAVAQA